MYRLKTAVTTGSANYAQWGLDWTYDRYGSRTNQTVTAGTAPTNSLSIDPVTNRVTGTGYSYDANGNMTGEGLNSLAYDAENRVVSVNAGATQYCYDGNSLRVMKVSGSTSTCSSVGNVYIFSGTKMIAEYENGAAPGSPTREYIYSGRQLLATIAGSSTTYHHDHLSARVVTNTSGNIVAQSGHYPFGEVWYEGAGAGKWKFTTYERDAESLNDYAMARYYVNRFGRFCSPDPLGGSTADPQSLNRYAYVHNDPVNFTDPLGLRCVIWYNFNWHPSQTTEIPHEPPVVQPGYWSLNIDVWCFADPRLPGERPCRGPECREPREPSVESLRSKLAKLLPCVPTWLKEKGKRSFKLLGQRIDLSASATIAYVSVGLTGDLGAVVGFPPYPSFGASGDVTINGPQPSDGPVVSPYVGFGKNLSVGTNLTKEGAKGFNASAGPSEGPPVGVNIPLPFNLWDILVQLGLKPCDSTP